MKVHFQSIKTSSLQLISCTFIAPKLQAFGLLNVSVALVLALSSLKAARFLSCT